MPIDEQVFDLPAKLSDDERYQSVKEIEKLITDTGGEVNKSEELGERKMAYKVKENNFAYYHLIEFNSPPDFIVGLNKHYRINERYIRDIVIKKEGKDVDRKR